MTAGAGRDVVVGGAGDDLLSAGDGANVLIGDSAKLTFAGGALVSAVSIDPADGGADTLAGGAGDDVIVGGVGGDAIDAGEGNNVVLGDDGELDFTDGVLVEALSTDTASGGDDQVTAGAGRDVVVGGFGSDSLSAGDGANVLAGDSAQLTFDPVSGALVEIVSLDPANGDADTIAGGAGDDVILGGAAGDTIGAGEGDNVVFGDDGDIDFANGLPTHAISLDTPGGDDLVAAGAGRNVLVGGAGDDSLVAGDGDDVVVGDGAELVWDGPDGDPATLDVVRTILPADDGDDTLMTGAGNDVILGGVGSDTIDAGNGDNVVLGDNGEVDFYDGALLEVLSTDLAKGDADDITTGAGRDVLIGGPGTDTLLAGDGANLVFPAGAELLYEQGTGALLSATSLGSADGSGDTIVGGAGDDVIVGGPGADTIDAGDGDNIVVGDLAEIDYTDGVVSRIVSTDEAVGGNDTITAGSGRDVIVGGAGDDTIDAGAGDNLVLGDSGVIVFDPATGLPVSAASTATATGGDDSIATGAGDDVVVGGSGADSIVDAGGSNVVLGDNGSLTWSGTGFADVVATAPTDGAADSIEIGGSGSNWVMGEGGGDTIATGAGDDLIFGDFGELNSTFTSIFTAVADSPAGADDTIDAGDGRNIVLGGQGADRITSGSGDDDLIGGSNVAGAADAGDWIDGGAGDDVIAGDNASVVANGGDTSPLDRTLTGTTIYDTGSDLPELGGPALDPIHTLQRTIVLWDGGSTAAPGTWGADMIAGGAGNDLIFGENGDDTIQGDGTLPAFGTTGTLGTAAAPGSAEGAATDGMDYVEGGAGADLIFGGLGQDDLIGGSSDLFGYATPEQRDSDGADTIFGDLGDAASIDDPGDTSANGHSHDADTILGDNGDVFRLVDAAGAYLTFAYDTYAGESERLVPRAVRLVDYGPALETGAGDFLFGESGNDVVYGETGADRIYGGGGDDQLIGGDGGDWISGGVGDDGILGDDGLLLVARGGVAEPLYGLAATTQTTIDTDDGIVVTVSVTGELAYTAVLESAGTGGDDILYGGLGNDFLHGGAGDDAMSGAEALPSYYAYESIPAGQPLTSLAGARDPLAYLYTTLGAYYTAGDPLGYDPATGLFRYFDPQHPFEKITVDPSHLIDFLLDFVSATAFDPADYPSGVQPVVDDGVDALFGDSGNDWLVGGTNMDFLFGGSGNDLLQADDDLDSTRADSLNGQPVTYDGLCSLAASYSSDSHDAAGLCRQLDQLQSWQQWLRTSDLDSQIDGLAAQIAHAIGDDYTPDQAATLIRLLQALKPDYDPNANDVVDPRGTAPTFADVAVGGSGNDILIANTASDRLVDGDGPGNAFYYPWHGDDDNVVIREPDHADVQAVVALGLALGGDPMLGSGGGSHDWWPYGPGAENPGVYVGGGSDASYPHDTSASLGLVVLATPSAELGALDGLARAAWLDDEAEWLLERIVVRGQLTAAEQAALSARGDAALAELAGRGLVVQLDGAWVATDAVWYALHLADPPAITGVSASTTTESAGVAVSGTGVAGDTISILDGALVLGTATVSADGTWSLIVHPAVGAGVLTATQTVEAAPHAGLTSGRSNGVHVTVLPDAPAIGAVSTPGPATPGHAASVTIGGGGADAGDTIAIYDGHRLIGSATVAADGTWTLTVSLGVGTHALTATQSTGCDGRHCDVFTSPASAVTTVTVYAPPAPPSVTQPKPYTVAVDFVLSGRGEAGDLVIVYDAGVEVGRAVVGDDGRWSAAVHVQTGRRTLAATETDPRSGFTSDLGSGVTIVAYATPPTPTILSVSTASPSSSGARVTVQGAGGAAGDVVRVCDEAGDCAQATVAADGSWSVSLALPIGSHVLTATDSPVAGVVSALSAAVSVTVPPPAPSLAAPATAGPSGFTVSGRGIAGDTIDVYDGDALAGTAVVARNGTWSLLLTLPAGTHVLTATQTDAASGITGAAASAVTVDVVVPLPPAIVSASVGRVRFFSAPVSVAGSGVAGDVVTVYDGGRAIGSARVGGDGGWQLTVTLGSGTHALTATEAGHDGIASAASATATVDVPLYSR